VLEIELGRLDAVRARRPKRLPVVLAPEEVAAVLQHVDGADGVFQFMARLLSLPTSGLRPDARRSIETHRPFPRLRCGLVLPVK
jgi:hypothetical protein